MVPSGCALLNSIVGYLGRPFILRPVSRNRNFLPARQELSILSVLPDAPPQAAADQASDTLDESSPSHDMHLAVSQRRYRPASIRRRRRVSTSNKPENPCRSSGGGPYRERLGDNPKQVAEDRSARGVRDRTGPNPNRSALGPCRNGPVGALSVTNGHQRFRGTAGRRPSTSCSRDDASSHIRLWSRRSRSSGSQWWGYRASLLTYLRARGHGAWLRGRHKLSISHHYGRRSRRPAQPRCLSCP
jgi:hypothetical protein